MKKKEKDGPASGWMGPPRDGWARLGMYGPASGPTEGWTLLSERKSVITDRNRCCLGTRTELGHRLIIVLEMAWVGQ